MSNKEKFAFLGVGNMANAIIGAMETNNICLYDLDKSKCNSLCAKRPLICADSVAEALEYADYVFLSVKPQNFADLLSEIAKSVPDYDSKVYISIAAGISTDYIENALGKKAAVIRTMPNTPMLYGAGVTAICRNERVSDENFETIKSIFSSCSCVFELPQDKMNAIISATSSSPAYVFLFIKAIHDSALAQGLDIEIDTICDLVSGSAQMLKQSPLSADELISMVTSKGGTTEQAMRVFREKDLCGIVDEAMLACTKRAEELGK